MGISVGIDLGTSNSAIAVQKLTAQVLLNAEGEDLTPSCVTVLTGSESGNIEHIVGRPARDLLKQHPRDTVLSVKRLMGREFEEREVRAIIAQGRTGYTIETDATEPGSIRIPLAGRRFSPENISSFILDKVVHDASTQLGEKITHAVVTVPAYFSDRQKFATRAACEQAQLNLLRLLPEPTAAAVSYGIHEMDKDSSKTIMVFDLGGGTFDVSVLSVAGGHFMEVTKGGDMWLGGDDIDKLIRDFVYSLAEKNEPGLSIQKLIDMLNPAAKARFQVEILEECERAKIELSSRDYTIVESYGILRDAEGQFFPFEMTITREDLDGLLQPMTDKLLKITKAILADVRFEPELIDLVLMVGGSSLIPKIQDALKSSFGAEKVHVHPRPMFAVVEGAAIMARSLASSTTETSSHSINLMHSTAHDYYLQLANGSRHLLVRKNTPLPCSVEEELCFSQEGQKMARLRVFNDCEGVLETVGEMWVFQDQRHALYTIEAEKDIAPSSFTLRFLIDEDNIIRMETNLLNKSGSFQQAVIARGGLAVWLFAELEKTLSRIFAKVESRAQGVEFMQLAQTIVDNILLVSNPLSGVVDNDLKKKIMAQTEAIEVLGASSEFSISHYHFMTALLEHAPCVFSQQIRGQCEKDCADLGAAILDLTDAEKMKTLCVKIHTAINDDEDMMDIIRGVSIAMHGKVNWPRKAERILAEVHEISKALLSGRSNAAQDHREQLEYLTSEFSSSSGPAEKVHFDRDVKIK